MQNNNATGTGLALDGAAAVTGQAWRDAWRLQARRHPWMTAGLALSMAAVTLMLISGIADGLSGGGAPLPLTSAIALQDIPEGLAVVMALRAAGVGAWRAVLMAGASGLMEPLGALFGVGIAGGLAVAYPIGLGLAAGAMIFVVSHEVIPETHRNGHQTPATLGLMAGFAVMMFLDTALG